MTLSGFSITAVTKLARLGPYSSIRLNIMTDKYIVYTIKRYLCLRFNSSQKLDSCARDQTEATKAIKAIIPQFYDSYDFSIAG